MPLTPPPLYQHPTLPLPLSLCLCLWAFFSAPLPCSLQLNCSRFVVARLLPPPLHTHTHTQYTHPAHTHPAHTHTHITRAHTHTFKESTHNSAAGEVCPKMPAAWYNFYFSLLRLLSLSFSGSLSHSFCFVLRTFVYFSFGAGRLCGQGGAGDT